MTSTTTETVVIRRATAADADALKRLAQLDSARVPAGDVLVAEVDGELRAALRVADNAVIADPFVTTSDLVELLTARAARLRGPRAGRAAAARDRIRLWSQLWHRAANARPSV